MSLFDGLFSSAPSSGLLAANSGGAGGGVDWWKALGLLGASLQDYGTHGRTNHLSDAIGMYQQMADKQKKDAIAQRLGDAFTQPNQVAVTPAVNDMSAQAPQLRTQAEATNAQPFATPSAQDLAPVLAQGIGAGVDPTPYLNLQKLESKQNVRILTPDEMKSYGFRPGTVGIMDENGVPKVLQSSDVKSQDAFKQEMDLKQPELNLRAAAQAEAARHDKAMEAQGDTPPDPNTVKYWAQSVAGGAPMPVLGMGKQAAAYRQAILAEVAKVQTASGKSGADQNAVTGSYKANVSTLAKITPLRAATEAYENTMLQNMDAAKGMIAKGAGTTGVPVINRWQRYIKGEYKGDPDVAAFNTAIQTVKNEYAKIQSGSIGNTPVSDASRKEAEGMINPNMTPEQIIANFNYMTKETGNRARALRAQEGALRSGLSGQSDLPNVPGIHDPQAAMAHPQDIQTLLQKYGVQ